MRIFIYIITISALFASCGSVEITDDNFTDLIDMDYPPVITFEDEEINFGKVVEGKQIYRTVNFTNTGKGPLIISTINGSCGCMIPRKWPKDPIKPGEKASFQLEFNTEGRVGITNKSITISANTKPGDSKLKITGTVIGPTN